MMVPHDRVLGQLYLSVKEGKSFAIEETADVYCVLQLENQQIQTTTCAKLAAKSQPTWNEGYNFDVTTTDAQIFVAVWGKTVSSPDGKCYGSLTIPVKAIGKAQPSQNKETSCSKRSHVWMPLTGNANGAQLRCEMYYTAGEQKVGLEDFTVLRQLGRGAFGDVMLVQKKDTGGLYAMKVCKKDRIISMDVVDLALKERNLIKSFNHPFVVSLKFSFKTKRHLFLIMDYIGGGELFYHMAEQRSFNEDVVQFYAAQLVLALGFLHEHNIIYRDLKPENLLLDIRGNICLCDFGMCKEQLNNEMSYTMCGSTEYMSPEALRGKGYGREVDWWALGVVLYEMLTGRCLFQAPNKADVHNNILYGPIPFSDSMSKNAMSLILNLLKRDPAKRLGAGPNGVEDIKAHPFFNGIDWKKLLHKEIEPPFKPHLVGAMDLKYFDPACTEAVPEVAASPRLDTYDECFGNFSYVAPLEVFRADHGIQFIKGASFGKLPLFPHLERTHSVSPVSWNPLTEAVARISPRTNFSQSAQFGNCSPNSPLRESNSPRLSLMSSTPPTSAFESTSPRKKVLSVSIPEHHFSANDSPRSVNSPQSPTSNTSPTTSIKIKRPSSLPDSNSPSHTAMRFTASTIGHAQSRRGVRDEDEEDETILAADESRDAQPPVLMQQAEWNEEDDMGITRRTNNLRLSRSVPAEPGTTSNGTTLSTSSSARPSLKDSRRAREEREAREAREAKGIKERENSFRDSKMKKSFKDLLSGFFSGNKKSSSNKA